MSRKKSLEGLFEDEQEGSPAPGGAGEEPTAPDSAASSGGLDSSADASPGGDSPAVKAKTAHRGSAPASARRKSSVYMDKETMDFLNDCRVHSLRTGGAADVMSEVVRLALRKLAEQHDPQQVVQQLAAARPQA